MTEHGKQPDDQVLRVAAFREVQRLADVNGELSSRDLAAGFRFDGQRIPLINPQRRIFKPTRMRYLLRGRRTKANCQRRSRAHGRSGELTTLMTMGRMVGMQTIQASKFKARCLALMDEVARTGETIVVTKNGRPVAELRPHRGPRAKSLIGLHKGRIKIKGDIISPIGTELWEALK